MPTYHILGVYTNKRDFRIDSVTNDSPVRICHMLPLGVEALGACAGVIGSHGAESQVVGVARGFFRFCVFFATLVQIVSLSTAISNQKQKTLTLFVTRYHIL